MLFQKLYTDLKKKLFREQRKIMKMFKPKGPFLKFYFICKPKKEIVMRKILDF